MNAPAILTADDRQKLLRWARQALEAAVTGAAPIAVVDTDLTTGLQAPHGAFVTLKKGGDLRGCIGQMDFERPLWENVIAAAVAAALEDPRVPGRTAPELGAICLEISVLEPPVDLPRPELFDAQRQGIIIQKGWARALLLPKVAQEYGWDAAQTLATVCRKAGLPPEAWRAAEARLQVFEAFDFGEPQ